VWVLSQKPASFTHILSARIAKMIKNPALKIKNRLCNFNVLLAPYLEYFLFKCFYTKWCTNISVVISNTEKKQTTSTVSCNYESQPLKSFLPYLPS
jgi:hypothetical protein